MLLKIKHWAQRFIELGPHKSVKIIHHKILHKTFQTALQKKIKKGFTGHSWQDMCKQYKLVSFETFFSQIKNKNLPNPLWNIPESEILYKAHEYSQNYFNILGSGKLCFNQIPWHEDFRLRAQNPHKSCNFDATSFYKSINITCGGSDSLEKDIKIPWELSRCQHLPILGKAYEITHDQLYAQTFVYHVTDWQKNNPYLHGTNWVCPMEVGIRAINWILAWQYVKKCPEISVSFWQQFVCSLYDHMHYLEHNWEWYDGKTSNHYLSDLVGYFYLCWFFQELPGIPKKRNWCYQEILEELEKQIFEEGSDYEGSTSYHRLVTELYYHAFLLAQEFKFETNNLESKLKNMFDFINACTIADANTITVGDNDSGVISYHGLPLRNQQKENSTLHYYPSFGLSIIKNEKIHLSLRHHAYNNNQPTGHFHNDALSITLAVDNIPIFIDPGSYVYTPSKFWRNYFRSVNVHNTFFIEQEEPVPFDNRMFALAMPISHAIEKPLQEDTQIILKGSHSLYNRFGLQAQRSIIYEKNKFIIADQWKQQRDINNSLTSCWNFTLHPAINAIQQDQHLMLTYKNSPLIIFSSDLEFALEDSWVSFSYGSKVPSKALKAKKIMQAEPIHISLEITNSF
jgi:hypothetical protein